MFPGASAGGGFAGSAFNKRGMPPHPKVPAIFARPWHRDGKDVYLKDMPLVARYLRKACERYSELSPLRKILDKVEDKVTVLGYTMDAGSLGRRSE